MKRTPVAALFFAGLLCACNPGSASDADGTDTESGSSQDETETHTHTETETQGESEVIQVEAAWVMGAAGAWLGEVRETPVGTLEVFPLDFAYEDDGSLHAHSAFPDDSGYFDFRFREQDETWVLDEEGKFPGGLLQSYTLHPVEQEGERVRYEYLDMPGYIVVDVVIGTDSLLITAQVKGELHAVFDLKR